MAHYEPDLECAKDIAQEVFETLWEKRELINDENEIRMVKWLCETARRKSLGYNRKTDRARVDLYENPEIVCTDFSSEDEEWIYNEGYHSVEEKYQKYLSEIKKSLNKKDRKMFILVVEKKLDAASAAKKLGISDVNFRVRWCRLRLKLRPIVDKIIKK